MKWDAWLCKKKGTETKCIKIAELDLPKDIEPTDLQTTILDELKRYVETVEKPDFTKSSKIEGSWNVTFTKRFGNTDYTIEIRPAEEFRKLAKEAEITAIKEIEKGIEELHKAIDKLIKTPLYL